MILGYDVFRIYQPLKYHFNGEYNFFKYKGLCANVNAKTYTERNDRFYFEKVGQQKTKQECYKYFVTNMANNRHINITELHGLEADHIHLKWTARRLAMDHTFFEDVVHLCKLDKPWKEILIGSSMIPPILGMYQQRILSEETIIILDNLFGMFDKWSSNLIVDDQVFQLRNYADFITIDKKFYSEMFKRAINFKID